MTSSNRQHVGAGSLARTFGWGIFCACSWTWCIGMYLPVILLRDYGWSGFVAFAVPNVLGCAAFGYVVATREKSRELLERMPGLIRWFSAITIAYHLFFLGWKINPFASGHPPADMALGALVAGMIGLAGWLVSFVVGRSPLFTAVCVYAASIAVFPLFGVRGLVALPLEGPRGTVELLWLLPSMWFGFLLCPYLDATFHRALQRSPSRHAFLVFGAAFFVMILLTCAYAAIAADRLQGAILVHVVAQSVFTIGAHADAMRRLQPSPSPWGSRATAFVWGLSIALGAWCGVVGTVGEAMYLRFLGFYGLVFPLLFLWRQSAAGRRWLGAAVVLAICLPLYEAGFVHREVWVLPIAVALAIVAPAIVQRFQSRRLETSEIPLEIGGQ